MVPVLDTQREAWAEHLREVFQTLEIPSGVVADNLIASVATYCRNYHPHGLKSSDLKLLVARAFCAVDDHAAAGRVLMSMEPHRRHVARWLEILSELHHFPTLLPFFSLGIIRPADWAGARLDRMWTLDFNRLSLTDADRHEIMLYQSIRAIIKSMLVFWDATEGEGVLGLKGLSALNLEGDTGRGRSAVNPDGFFKYIADLFLQQKEARNWRTVPSLLNHDL